MAAHGRPTPQPPIEGDRPRFRDRPADGAEEEGPGLDINPYFVSHRTFGCELLPADEAALWYDRWSERFGREAPLHVEIGSGNGFFLTGLAARHPEWNVLGLEIRYKRTVLTARKIRKHQLSNALIARYHAAYLDDLFAEGTLAGLYVNHPDPWPKGRHEKNRLVSRWFLQDAARFLRPGGWLRIKSDFRDNVDRVAGLLSHGPDGEPLATLPFEITGRSDDVNSGPAPWPDDIVTNYQRKMAIRGKPVYAMELVRG